MKNYKALISELSEALWPGSPEYKKKFGGSSTDGGSRHDITKASGVVRATRKYDATSGESEEPTKNREDAAAAPVKRGRGRPPGKYGSYKKKVTESLEILEALETEEDIAEFIDSLDEESFAELEAHFALDEAAMSHAAKTTMKHVKDATPGEKKAAKDIKPGIAGYRDRVAMLKSAETRGGVKEEVVDEKYMGAEKLTSELKSKGAKDPKALAAWIGRKKYGKEEFQKAAAKGEKMSESEVDEALKHPNHKVLDKNKNNKLDKEDFAILRGEKKAPMKEETTDDGIAMLAAFITKQAKGEA